MPELPEVERARRLLASRAAGRRVKRVVVADPHMLRNASPSALGRALRGHRFEDPDRHGKWLIARTTGPAILLHFGMTGDLAWATGRRRRDPHDRVVFVLEGGELRYRSVRRLGGVWLARAAEGVESMLEGLGPDALGLDSALFRELLAGRRARIKAALIDQRRLAGVGNILADEALWRSGIHPATRLDAIGERQLDGLHSALRAVLTEAIESADAERGGGWLANVRGNLEARCPRCGAGLQRTTVAGRTAVFCPSCQVGPSS